MVTISDLKKNWSNVNLLAEVPKIIESTKNEIIRLNTQEQLFNLGQDSLGNQLPPYKNKRYEAYKLTKNPSGKMDLKLYGGFYSGWRVDVDSKYFNVYSVDEKAEKLELRFTKFIFGINQANTEIYALDTAYPKIQDYITSKTGLVFR